MATQKIKFLRKSAAATNYSAALAAAKGKNPVYGEPIVVKYMEGAATKLAFFIGIDGAGAVHEVGSYETMKAIQADLSALKGKVGDVANLSTTAKDTLVHAINELKAKLDTAITNAVTSVAPGPGISVDSFNRNAPRVSAKVATSETGNILVVDETKGLYATLDFTYNKSTGNLTLSGSNSFSKSVNLVIPSVVKSGRYDSKTNELILVLNDDSEVKIPASGLIDEWTVASTATLELIRDAAAQPTGTTVLKGNVKVSAEEGNQLIAKADGLFVAATDLTAITGRVASLESVVGNASRGLVKKVADLETAAAATLENVVAGSGIAVTAKSGQAQTISVKVDNASIKVGSDGNMAVDTIDGGEF